MDQANPRCPFRHLYVCLVIILSALFLMRQPVSAATGSFIAVDRNHKISGSLREVTIAEALKKIGEKIPLRVEGSPPVDQVGLQLQHLTLDETLRKIMRGYNYVLLDPGSSGVAVLTIMGRIERSQSTAGHSGPEPNPGQTSSHGSNTHPEPANSQLIPSNAQDPDRSSEHPPGPPTAGPGASNGGAAPAQNESEGTIADGPGSSSNSESAPSKDGDAQNSDESDNGSPPRSASSERAPWTAISTPNVHKRRPVNRTHVPCAVLHNR